LFIGHIAIGFGTKKLAPEIKLGTLLLASQWLDLIFPIFVLLGFEHVKPDPGNTAFTPYNFYDYPFSHSLLAKIRWAILIGGSYFLIRRRWKETLVLACGVLSHWLLDFISHRPDMPIAPGLQMYVGLGLWNSIPATVIFEACLFALGIAMYLHTTSARDRIGHIALWLFVSLHVFLYIGNILSRVPGEGTAMAFGGFTQWLIIPWAYWIDQHRQTQVIHPMIHSINISTPFRNLSNHKENKHVPYNR
jgi:hypothetical protein